MAMRSRSNSEDIRESTFVSFFFFFFFFSSSSSSSSSSASSCLLPISSLQNSPKGQRIAEGRPVPFFLAINWLFLFVGLPLMVTRLLSYPRQLFAQILLFLHPTHKVKKSRFLIHWHMCCQPRCLHSPRVICKNKWVSRMRNEADPPPGASLISERLLNGLAVIKMRNRASCPSQFPLPTAIV